MGQVHPIGVPMSSPPIVGPLRDSAGRTRRIERTIVAAVVAVVVVIGAFEFIRVLEIPRTGPAELFVTNATRVEPGSIGCGATPGELCFSLTAGISVTNLRLSDVEFELTNETGQSSIGPNAPPEPVGASAGVSVLGSPTLVVGHWNWSARVWTDGSGWNIPTTVELVLIVDSGLLYTTSLGGTLFSLSITPTGGSAGTFLP